MKLKYDVSCHLPDVYTEFQIDFTCYNYIEKKSRKLGPTEGGISPRYNVAVFYTWAFNTRTD